MVTSKLIFDISLLKKQFIPFNKLFISLIELKKHSLKTSIKRTQV